MTAFKFIWITGLILTLAACSPLKIRKGVQNHTFYSSAKPAIGIKLNPDFEYVAYKTSTRTALDVDDNNIYDRVLVSQELYTFENKNEKRTIVIALKNVGKPGWAFKPGMFPEKKPFSKGRTSIQGNSYQHSTYALKHLSDYYLVKGYGRLAGLSNTLLLIHYVEKQDDSWERPMLTDKQKEALSSFELNCENDLQILEEVTLPAEDDFQAPSGLGGQEDAAVSAFLETLMFPRAVYSTRK
jgi:hypothetical protein